MTRNVLPEAFEEGWEHKMAWDYDKDEDIIPSVPRSKSKDYTPPINLKSPVALKQDHSHAIMPEEPPMSVKEALVKGREARQRIIEAINGGELKIGELYQLEDFQKITGLSPEKTLILIETFQQETAGFYIKHKIDRHGNFLGFRITSKDINRKKQLDDFCAQVEKSLPNKEFTIPEIAQFSKNCGFDNPNYILRILRDNHMVEKLSKGKFKLVT